MIEMLEAFAGLLLAWLASLFTGHLVDPRGI